MKLQSVNINQCLRAFAIMFVVANHATWYDLGGGMNFLMLLSGFNFAAFSFAKDKVAIIKDLWRLTLKIVIPSMIIISCYFILKGRFEFKELFMVSNFFYLNKVSDIALPIWYPQVFLQMAIILSLLFYFTPLAKVLRGKKVLYMLMILVAAIAINVVSKHYWNFSHLLGRMPHLFLWNFILGWCFCLMLEKPTLKNNILVSMAFMIAMLFVMGGFGESNRFYIFSGLVLAFIWLKNLKFPPLIARGINLVASATFFIFLSHLSFFEFYQWMTHEIEIAYKLDVLLKFSFAILGSVLLWLLLSSANTARQRVW